MTHKASWVNARLMLLFIVLLHSTACRAVGSPIAHLALYYGTDNRPELKLYKHVVVQPYNALNPKTFNTADHEAFVYASIGETKSLHFNGRSIDKHWIIGKNKAWKTLILDQANPAWQRFFLDNIITVLWNKGYRGFYLDTLDSYHLITTDPVRIKQQQAGIVTIIKAIKQKYPQAKLILNRGFELLPDVHDLITRMTVESVFAGWDPSRHYYRVSPQNRIWVLRDIETAKKMGVPITIIDYIDPENPQKSTHIAEQISHIGCSAWITNPDLTQVYFPHETKIPRKILVFYDGQLNNVDERIGAEAIRSLAMPLNQLGYRVDVRNINEPLPTVISNEDYAGIIMAIDGLLLGREHELHHWYLAQLRHNIPLVILHDFGFMVSDKKLKPFGLSLPILTHQSHTLHTVYRAPLIGYELEPSLKPHAFIPIQLKATTGRSLLKVRDEVGLEGDLAGLTTWGGYYLGSSFLPEVIDGEYRWAMNPFQFFKHALHLPDLPIPDTTTENGMRLMFTQIDGDGFSSKAEWYGAPYVGEIMLKEIIDRYQLPTTVSIVQGEIAANGLYPAISAELEAIAKTIFSRPNVEIASHTFSHPYNWHNAAAFKGKGPNRYSLPIPHYHFNLDTEINGSVHYINKTLAPPGKTCKVFLWSGEGDVPEEALMRVHNLGLHNLNPRTIITKYNPSLTRISALGVNEGLYFQIFAPIGNDQEVQGKGSERIFYALIKIINALQLTDKPQRLKPLDIYIHFFTLAQPGGIKALQMVYTWALTQPIMPIFASEYADKVMDFNQLVMLKKGKGWLIATHDALRELRIPQIMGYPDLINSHNIIGYNAYNNDYYIHLGPGGDAYLQLTTAPPSTPYLVSANARITQFVHNNHPIQLTFEGHVPVQFTLAHTTGCQVLAEGKPLTPTDRQSTHYVLQNQTTAEVSIQCP